MLKKIYKSLVLSRTASVANETLRTLSDRQLDDIGLSRATFVNEIVQIVTNEDETITCDLFLLCHKNNCGFSSEFKNFKANLWSSRSEKISYMLRRPKYFIKSLTCL